MAEQTNGGFAKAFIPGLIVGLIVGAVLGAVLPPFFESGGTSLTPGTATSPESRGDMPPRDEREGDSMEEMLEDAGDSAEDALEEGADAAGDAVEEATDAAGDLIPPAPAEPEGEG